ncbi:hypothetical protein MMC21_004791 [Puttea exsequens]|nr:hypothetical protein [Puttea exsequens]
MWASNAALISTVPDLACTLLNQHLLPIVMRKTLALGGNSLRLDPSEGPLIMSLLSVTWDSASDDMIVVSTITALIEQIESAAKKDGFYNAFKYLNYAYEGQDMIGGYGLRSREYDPKGFFQTAVPGESKLFAEDGSDTTEGDVYERKRLVQIVTLSLQI